MVHFVFQLNTQQTHGPGEFNDNFNSFVIGPAVIKHTLVTLGGSTHIREIAEDTACVGQGPTPTNSARASGSNLKDGFQIEQSFWEPFLAC